MVSVTDHQHSFSDFFKSNIQPLVAGSSETRYGVESAQVGPCKDHLYMVDLGLQVCQVDGKLLALCEVIHYPW